MAQGRTFVALVVGLLVIGGLAFNFDATAQDQAQPQEFSPFDQPVAQPGGTLPGNPAIQLVQVAGGLIDPINLANAGDGSGRLFVVERTGTIRIVNQDGSVVEDPFLDIQSQVKTDFLEQGLLGLAFHPDYETNGRFFVYYSDYSTNGKHFLVEYTVSADDPNVANPDSGRVLLSIEDPFTNHNGGTLHFGPDGYLYISIGDGGSAGDPYDNAQDTGTLLGKLLRIDVNRQGEEPYAIPSDNPFAGGGRLRQASEARPDSQVGEYRPDARPEIWAYGLRNPWQFSFDPETGDLYVTDVGQNRWEEVNYQPAGSPGGQNYGWDPLEGAHCYPPATYAAPGTPVPVGSPVTCFAVGVAPVAEYNHDDGSCSIAGIGVYRGEASPALDGIHFTTDFCSGKVWGLARDDAGAWAFQELLDTELLATGAGQGEDGELYLLACSCAFGRTYDPFEDPQGTVWRIVAADQVPEGATVAPTQAPDGTAPEEPATPAPAGEAPAATPAAGAGGGDAEGVTVVSVDIAFEPAEFSVPADTEVPVTLPNEGALPHNFSIDQLGIDVDIDPGATQETTLTAPAGQYEYYCNVPGHKEAGMVGTLTAE